MLIQHLSKEISRKVKNTAEKTQLQKLCTLPEEILGGTMGIVQISSIAITHLCALEPVLMDT